MSFRHTIGALLYDWPRYRRVMKDGRWILYRNREERIATDGRGVRCEWRFASDLHIAKVFPSLGTRLMQAAFDEWPVTLRDTPFGDRPPVVSFGIGHSGIERLPHLLLTLRSIAGQDGVPVECIVVEQAAAPEAEGKLPPWVRYVFLKSQEPYNRAATFNAGAAVAHAGIVIPHDNDILVPSRYAAEVTARVAEGFRFA